MLHENFFIKKLNKTNTSYYFLTVEKAAVSLPTKCLGNPMNISISYIDVISTRMMITIDIYRYYISFDVTSPPSSCATKVHPNVMHQEDAISISIVIVYKQGQ